jgi:hypothetical protein
MSLRRRAASVCQLTGRLRRVGLLLFSRDGAVDAPGWRVRRIATVPAPTDQGRHGAGVWVCVANVLKALRSTLSA